MRYWILLIACFAVVAAFTVTLVPRAPAQAEGEKSSRYWGFTHEEFSRITASVGAFGPLTQTVVEEEICFSDRPPQHMRYRACTGTIGVSGLVPGEDRVAYCESSNPGWTPAQMTEGQRGCERAGFMEATVTCPVKADGTCPTAIDCFFLSNIYQPCRDAAPPEKTASCMAAYDPENYRKITNGDYLGKDNLHWCAAHRHGEENEYSELCVGP